MAASHTLSTTFILVVLFLFVICLASPPASSSPIRRSSSLLKKNGSLAVRLVHRSSPESPFHDSNATREDLIREGLNISLARSRYYGQGVIYQTNSLYATTPISHDFVMKYTRGTPPFETLGILDTRSILTWMQCLPCLQCRRDQITDHMFDPRSSTTFMNVPCDAILCTEISNTYCIGGTCNYHVEYLNGKTSDGVIAMDVLGVEALVSGVAPFPNPAIFGCDFNNRKLAGNSHGVIGLGNGSNSFLKQIPANQFTYLFSENGSDIGGWIYFGLEGPVSGYPTPLVPNEFGSYYLILEGISVDGNMLNIPSEDFNLKNDGTGGFSIDSGSTFTLLRDNAFDALRQEIMRYWDEEEPTNVDGFELCFEEMTPAPEIVFNISKTTIYPCPLTTLGLRRASHTTTVWLCQGLTLTYLSWACINKETWKSVIIWIFKLFPFPRHQLSDFHSLNLEFGTSNFDVRSSCTCMILLLLEKSETKR